MAYKLIDFTVPGRCTQTFGVGNQVMTFNREMQRLYGIAVGRKIVCFVNDKDGTLSLSVVDGDSPTGYPVNTAGADRSKGVRVCITQLARHLDKGRFHITGRDGAFLLTDCKYHE